MRKVSGLEAVKRDYAPRGVRFFFIYKSLAHPETNGYVTPYTLAERLMHVKEAERTTGSTIPWLCDTMSNELKHALGDAPNSEFIIDPAGRVVRKRVWSDPRQVRRDLEELVGKVENPTDPEDLDIRLPAAARVAARGVVPRIERPGSMSAVKVEPQITAEGQPFYAKLRAEADRELLGRGRGQLYLRFYMDPLYRVHWNNLVRPLEVKIEAPEGVQLSETALSGPKVDEPADIDPREFLIDVERIDVERSADDSDAGTGPLKLSVSYFACNDEEGWCKPVSQEYLVRLEVDRDAGWTQRRRRGPRTAERSSRPAARGPAVARRPGARGSGARSALPRPPDRPDRPRATRGRLVEVDAKSGRLTVRTRDGRTARYSLTEGARLMRDRERADLQDFQPGDMVLLRVESRKKGPPLVRRLMARSRR